MLNRMRKTAEKIYKEIILVQRRVIRITATATVGAFWRVLV